MHLLDQNQNGEGVQVNFDCLSTEVESLMTIDQRLEIKQHTFTFDSDKTPNLIDMFTEILDQIISDCSSYDPKDVWNVPKMGDLIQKMGIQKVVIYLIKSHFVNAEFLLKFQKNFQKIFKCVIFVFDGTSVISTLPFDAAIDIEMNELCGRSMKDIVCDIITDLLRQGLVISKILIDYLLTRRSKTRLKHSLSIALLEHTQKYSAGAADKTVVDYVENLWLGFSLLIDVAGVLGIREMKSFLLGSVDTFKSSLESGNVPTTISSKDSTSFPVGDHIHNSSNHQWVQKSMVINQLICLPKFKKIRGYLNLDDHKTLHELVKSIGTLVRVDLRSIDDWRCVYVEFGQFMRKVSFSPQSTLILKLDEESAHCRNHPPCHDQSFILFVWKTHRK